MKQTGPGPGPGPGRGPCAVAHIRVHDGRHERAARRQRHGPVAEVVVDQFGEQRHAGAYDLSMLHEQRLLANN